MSGTHVSMYVDGVMREPLHFNIIVPHVSPHLSH